MVKILTALGLMQAETIRRHSITGFLMILAIGLNLAVVGQVNDPVVRLNASPEPKNDIDSIFNLAQTQIYIKPDSARTLLMQGIALAEHQEDQLWLTILYNAMGVSYLIQADYRNASEQLVKALRIAIRSDNQKRIGRTSNNLGILNKELGNHKDALSYYMQALDAFELSNDSSNRARVLSNISVLYSNLSNYDKALDYSLQALIAVKQLRDTIDIQSSMSATGSIFYLKKQHDTAFLYLDSAMVLAKKLNLSYGLSNTYRNLGEVYLSIRDYEKAIENYRESRKHAKAIEALNNEIYAELGLTSVYLATDSCEHALNHALRSLELAKILDSRKILSSVHKKLSDVYAKVGDFDQAYQHYRMSNEIKDELMDQNNLHQIYNLEMEKLNENMKLTRLEVQRQELLVSKRNSAIITIVLISIVIIFSMLLFYTNFRQKQKSRLNTAILKSSKERSKAALEAEIQERKRLGMELHDGVGPLLSLVRLNVMAMLKKENLPEDKKQKMLQNTLGTINEVLKDLRHISQNMAPMILIEKGFEVAVRNLVSKLNDTLNCRVNLDIYGLTADMEPYMEHALYVSILEIINNIIKHSGSTEFSIQIIQNNEDITVMIEDNGVGFSPGEAKDGKGLGLKSTDSRIKSMNGQFFIDSLPGQGTIITMIIPLLQTVEA